MNRTEKVSKWKFGFFLVWQEERESRWLKSMSAQGWHLKQVMVFLYRFEKGEPRDYEYSFDFITGGRTDLQEYRGLVEDTGWQYIDNMGGWQYFRIDADKAEGAEIYTDMDSLKAKYRRVLAFLCLSGFPLAMMFMSGSLDRLVENNSPLIYPIAVIMVMLLYAIFRLSIMVLRKQLRR